MFSGLAISNKYIAPCTPHATRDRTDTWALGCSLYMCCYLQNCFEENSSLAILSGNYIQPPDDHPYTHTPLHELIDRMLTVNVSRRADINEVCRCFDRLLVGKGLVKRPSGRKPKSSSSLSTSRSNKTNARGSATSSRDSPPPPPPPPRPPKLKGQKTQKQKTHLSDPIPPSVVVDRRSSRVKERVRAPLGEEDLFGDLLMGEKTLMQAVPEQTAVRSHRDPRKTYNRSQQVSSTSTATSTDHIYTDLLREEPSKRSRRKSKKSSTMGKIANVDDTLPVEDDLDRIRIFTSSDKIEMMATSTGRSDASFDTTTSSTPPLIPIEMSSITSASSASQGHYSFSKESPVRRKTRRDPPGTRYSV